MSLPTVISFLAAAASLGIAVWVFLRWGQSFVSFSLIAGLVLLGLEAGFGGLASMAYLPDEVLRWERVRALAVAVLPGVWLLFSSSFARAGYESTLAKWKWVIVSAFVLPLLLTVVFSEALFRGIDFGSPGWVVSLGWSGYALELFLLLSAVVILMNLERTFRASAGAARWEIKFMILGVAAVWGLRVYTASQGLLFWSMTQPLQAIASAGLFAACGMMAVSLLRGASATPELYLSATAIYNSLAVLVVGFYLLVVGVLTKAVVYMGWPGSIPLDSLFLFFALIGLSAVLLSDGVRQRTKKLLSRHLKRPQFDYRTVWAEFTRITSSIVEPRELSAAVTNMIARTFGVSSVALWVWNDPSRALVPLGATFPVGKENWELKRSAGPEQILPRIGETPAPIDLGQPENDWIRCGVPTAPGTLMRYALPLVSSREFLGFITMNEKLTKEPFTMEELALAQRLSDQTASILLNLKLSEDLMETRETETFQKMSAFFVHDLKNLASTLSLTVGNLPRHFDDPEFRADAMKTMTHSIDKMKSMCARLSPLNGEPTLRREENDLNAIIDATLHDLNGIKADFLSRDLHEIPQVIVDGEEVKKVVHNLILNALEASRDDGKVMIRTGTRGDSVMLSVSDNGCGMSREFITSSLFRPFRSTKKQGLGIGLFHCKQIVEAHKGRIEVESQEGTGTTFTVYFPVVRRGSIR